MTASSGPTTTPRRAMPDDGGEPAGRADTAPLRVVFAGTPEFAVPSLEALVESEHDVVGVLTQPDRPAGRGRKVFPSAVRTVADGHGLAVQQPRTLRDEAAREALASLAPDVLVVVAYGLILPPETLALPPLGCLNVHASLLPRWRGAAPVQRAILAGDDETGVCIMRMDAGLDTGDVIARAATPIDPDENAVELAARLAALGARTLLPALEHWRRGTAPAEPQPEAGATYAAKLAKGEAALDFSRPAIELHRQVRALHGWPVAESALEGERVRVWRSRLPERPAPAGAAPGTVVAADETALTVACGEGTLELLELQRPGGRALPAGAFAHDRELVGRRFETPVAAERTS